MLLVFAFVMFFIPRGKLDPSLPLDGCSSDLVCMSLSNNDNEGGNEGDNEENEEESRSFLCVHDLYDTNDGASEQTPNVAIPCVMVKDDDDDKG
ncbi:unnamed protein product [Lactuca saligna]|uniref:Secreted protein n=1 Tax=Lactuca saligna TaxID=75948 RepID=A0AA35YVX9_LACSI|nr:unnamed protein product [Lactuca saligna]